MTDTGTTEDAVIMWWTPDCKHLHIETNPSVIGPHCPDDVKPEAPTDD